MLIGKWVYICQKDESAPLILAWALQLQYLHYPENTFWNGQEHMKWLEAVGANLNFIRYLATFHLTIQALACHQPMYGFCHLSTDCKLL
jgi:hypothetical protein